MSVFIPLNQSFHSTKRNSIIPFFSVPQIFLVFSIFQVRKTSCSHKHTANLTNKHTGTKLRDVFNHLSLEWYPHEELIYITLKSTVLLCSYVVWFGVGWWKKKSLTTRIAKYKFEFYCFSLLKIFFFTGSLMEVYAETWTSQHKSFSIASIIFNSHNLPSFFCIVTQIQSSV